MAPHLTNIHIPQLRATGFEILNDWDLDGVGKTFNARVPAFLTTLRSNLQLSATGASSSLPASAISTPTAVAFSTDRGTTHAKPPGPSPLFISTLASAVPAAMSAAASSDPQPADELPELTYKVAPPGSEERVEALKLVADSVAQMRQVSSAAVILHPATLSATVLLIAIMSRYLVFSTLITTSVGMMMAGMLAVRMYTANYLTQAEKIGFKWLEDYSKHANGNGNGNGSRDPIVLIAKWGDEIIGALVMRVVKRERKGYVRAWTVKLRYRNKGVGRGLLEEGAKAVWGKGGRGMVFEDDHANAGRMLPDVFNRTFDKQEVKARDMLAAVVAETRKERSSR